MSSSSPNITASPIESSLVQANTHPYKGIFLLCLGVFLFSLQDLVIKKVSGNYPLTQVLFIRSLVSFPILLMLVHRETGIQSILQRKISPFAKRSIILFLSYLSYYMAFPALPLADAVALYFTVPLFVTAIAVPWLHEKAHPMLWWAVVLGFVGVVIMLKPTSGIFEPAAFLSLFSALTYAISMIMVRRMGNTETASMISFYQNIFFFLGATFFAVLFYCIGFQDVQHPSLKFLVRPWISIPLQDLLWIASCGVIASGGTMTLTAAYHIGPASKVGAFEYSGVLWAPMWGFIFFHEIPAFTTIMGAILIVIAGLMVLKPSVNNPSHP